MLSIFKVKPKKNTRVFVDLQFLLSKNSELEKNELIKRIKNFEIEGYRVKDMNEDLFDSTMYWLIESGSVIETKPNFFAFTKDKVMRVQIGNKSREAFELLKSGPKTFVELKKELKVTEKELSMILHQAMIGCGISEDLSTQTYSVGKTMQSKITQRGNYWSELPKKYPEKPVLQNLFSKLMTMFKKEKVPNYMVTRIAEYYYDDLVSDYKIKTKELIKYLETQKTTYKGLNKYLEMCDTWISDCYFILEDYDKAFDSLPKAKELFTVDINRTKRLYLEYLLNKPVDKYDLFNSGLLTKTQDFTDFTNKYKEEFCEEVQKNLEALQKNKSLLKSWYKENNTKSLERDASIKNRYWLFTNSSAFFNLVEKPQIYLYKQLNFEINPPIKEISEILRNSENNLRITKQVPKIGEGWVSETDLYHFIKNSFPEYEIIHSYKSDWLGNQHLDIFIPKLSLGIEYQGEQHFKPIKKFGGEQKFEENKIRDLAKKEKCKKNNITLIEVTEKYNQKELLAKIRNLIKK